MNVLSIDIGGTGVKFLVTGETEQRRFDSGPSMTPEMMVDGVKKQAADWKYDVVAIGYPGAVRHNQPIAEPHNLAPGWIGFDFEAAFGCPVKMINDAAMQALGSYKGGSMLFLGLGTGLGTAMVVEGTVIPMELAHLSIGKRTFEDDLGLRGLERLGRKKWEKRVHAITARFVSALILDEVVFGGGNSKKLKRLPDRCRLGDNANALLGGFLLWEKDKK
jgi:predicted NBD/HSP70 family sugar kinase